MIYEIWQKTPIIAHHKHIGGCSLDCGGGDGYLSDNKDDAPTFINSSSLDKMDVNSQTIFWGAFSWMKQMVFLIKISLKFVLKRLINNNPTLVEMTAWRRIGDKP